MAAAAPKGKIGAFIAVATLLAAVAVISYEVIVRGCNVDSLGSILGAKLACPQVKEVAAKAPQQPVAPGDFHWLYDKMSVWCTIPFQMGPVRHDVDNTLGLSATAVAMLINAILPYGDVNRIYECRVDARQGALAPALDPSFTASYKIQQEVEARFKEQGRVCGIVWWQVDWTYKEETVPGKRLRKKFCMEDGIANKIEDLN
jgi:hypothetical protein